MNAKGYFGKNIIIHIKPPQISSFCEEWKKSSTLSPIQSPTLKTLETNTKNIPSLLPHGNKPTLSNFDEENQIYSVNNKQIQLRHTSK